MKNFTLTFKSILLYIHKRGCKIKMTKKEGCCHVSWRSSLCGLWCPVSSFELLLCDEEISPILVSTFLSCSLKTQLHNVSYISKTENITTYTVVMKSPAALLTPGLWSALSCRPKRLPPWPPCRGEAVAEDSRLGDWAIMGEFGVEVSAPVSVRRCSSLCLCCCCSIWHTTSCCSWWGQGRRKFVGCSGHLWPPAWTCGTLNFDLIMQSCDITQVSVFALWTLRLITSLCFQNWELNWRKILIDKKLPLKCRFSLT